MPSGLSPLGDITLQEALAVALDGYPRLRKPNTFVSLRSSRYAGGLIPPGCLSVLFPGVP